jgi:tetratricopeptide (TPR) repeat protein
MVAACCGVALRLHAQEVGACNAVQSVSLQRDARNAMAAREYRAAAERFQQAISACPSDRSILLGLARAELARRNFNEAIRATEGYLAGDRGSIEGRLILTEVYFMAGRMKDALAEADQILHDRPDDAGALKLKANSAYLLGDFAKARDTFVHLLDRHPDDEDGSYMLGRIYYQERFIELAIGQFERALKLNPRSYKALDNLGLCYQALGDTQKAMRYFLTAIKLTEKDHHEYDWPCANLADLLLKMGDAQQAFNAASKAVERNAVSARNFYIGAKALDQLGKPELSLNWAQRAASLDQNYSEAWYLLARLYGRLGQEEKAEDARRRFRELKATEPSQRK